HATGPAGDSFITKLTADGSGLVYSTSVGPGDFSGKYADHFLGGIAVDSAGAAYVLGTAAFFHGGSVGIVTTPGAFQETPRGGPDGFVVKFDGTGAVVYATYLAGSGSDNLAGFVFGCCTVIPFRGAIAVDQAGRAWVTGSTSSA